MTYNEASYENAVIEVFRDTLGYKHVYGPNVTRDYRDPLYKEELEAGLARLNPNLPQAALDEALRKLKNFESGSPVKKNEQFMEYLQNGISVNYYDRRGRSENDSGQRSALVSLVDYRNARKNSFILGSQWMFDEGSGRRRPDMVVFLNGLPVVVIELKSPSRENTDASEGYQQLRHYQRSIPSLFIYNAFLVISDQACNKAGTITAGEDRFMEWKSKDGSYEKTQYAQFDTFFEGMFEPERVKPRCKYFGVCGGCQYQHIEYGAQLKYKHKQICDIFQRLGGFEASTVLPPLPNPSPWNYRNRVMIRSQWNKHIQGLHIGFIQHDCGLVVDVEECAIAEPEINRLITHVRQNPPPRGGLKVVLRKEPEDWQVGKDSFFQNNFHMLPGMVGALRERLADSGVRYLFDIYCGVGFLGIQLSSLVESFIGIELDKQAIAAAEVNATRRGIANGQFILGSAEEVLPEYIGRYPAAESCLTLDPPRRGCHPSILTLLRQIRPRQILYVSCHPATLARDLKLLCAEGLYELRQIQPLDMFSQTQHVECIADLRLES